MRKAAGLRGGGHAVVVHGKFCSRLEWEVEGVDCLLMSEAGGGGFVEDSRCGNGGVSMLVIDVRIFGSDLIVAGRAGGGMMFCRGGGCDLSCGGENGREFISSTSELDCPSGTDALRGVSGEEKSKLRSCVDRSERNVSSAVFLVQRLGFISNAGESGRVENESLDAGHIIDSEGADTAKSKSALIVGGVTAISRSS